jgi:hypothetical protein
LTPKKIAVNVGTHSTQDGQPISDSIFGEISIPGDQKKALVTGTKVFLGKKIDTLLPQYEDFF